MKVKELIAALEDFDPELEVKVFSDNSGFKFEINEVELDWDADGNAIGSGPVLITCDAY